MEHADAVALIDGGVERTGVAQQWADLGAGGGTFTRALAALLPTGSTIHAMDRDARALAEIPARFREVHVRTQVGDMQAPLPWMDLDGILLANALHYVVDQPAFVQRLAQHLKPHGRFLLVEYEHQSPNPWVPYPVGFAALQRLFPERTVTRLHERPSAFGRALLYAAVVR
jgi:trans-aconitate methyltransferase